MKALSVFLYLCFSATIALAQQNEPGNNSQQTDTISIIKTFGGTTYYDGRKQLKPIDSIRIVRKDGSAKYYQGATLLKRRDIQEITKGNTEAYNHISSARAQKGFATVMAVSGTALMVTPIAMVIFDSRHRPWELTALGFCLVGISIPITLSGSHHVKKAVDVYNTGVVKSRTSAMRPELKLGITSNGAGLVFTF